MEGQWPAGITDPLHLCYRWQPDRLRRKKDHEPAGYRPAMALGTGIYSYHYYFMAPGSFTGKCIFRAIPFFYRLFKKDREKNGVWQSQNGV